MYFLFSNTEYGNKFINVLLKRASPNIRSTGQANAKVIATKRKPM